MVCACAWNSSSTERATVSRSTSSGLQLDDARLYTRQVEHAHGEVAQAVHLHAHELQELLLLLGAQVAFVDELEEAGQREQRRLELV